MSDDPQPPAIPPAPLPAPEIEHREGFGLDPADDESADAALATIEMAGEEVALGWKPTPHKPLAPEVRYLHVSRTIHQLVTDRNRSVGIFLFVASVLSGASTALLTVDSANLPATVLRPLQLWCLPATFATLAILGAFMSLILVRTRIGLIYEVAKMNALLGLPSERVSRVNPLSIFFLMHLLVSSLGGASAGLAAVLAWWIWPFRAEVPGPASGPILHASAESGPWTLAAWISMTIAYIVIFQAIYYVAILRATSEARLKDASA